VKKKIFEGEAGMVTAETALTIPAIVTVAALVIGGLATVSTQNQVCYAARMAARSVAAGETDSQASALAHRVSSNPVNVSVSHEAQLATVSASAVTGGVFQLPVNCSVVVRKESAYQ
jgi:Flp pilus assembly protein TadG